MAIISIVASIAIWTRYNVASISVEEAGFRGRLFILSMATFIFCLYLCRRSFITRLYLYQIFKSLPKKSKWKCFITPKDDQSLIQEFLSFDPNIFLARQLLFLG